MNSQQDQTSKVWDRFDLFTMLAAIMALFLLLGTDAWWTLGGTTVNRLLNIRVSPFYVQIFATGLPSTVRYANALGSFTRAFLLLGFLALFVASLRPKAWWRNLTVYFGLSSLVELYLSFLLMFYWTQSTFVNTYGITPPFYGTSRVQASILGLDLAYHTGPQLTATFGILYYLGYVSIVLILGRTLINSLRERTLQVLAGLLSSGGIHDVYLTPPYHNVWFSSGGEELNPLRTDPEGLSDDELLVSFEKLYRTVEPGGCLSITLPTEEATLSSRLERLMPLTGFIIEESETTRGVQGELEIELHFRKPLSEEQAAPEQTETGETSETRRETIQIQPQTSAVLLETRVEPKSPPILKVTAEPAWTPRMSRLERSMLRNAVKLITDRREPVPYRELINEIYMELVDRKTEFDSARQIETTLLDHNGKELLLVEDTDEPTGRVVKKWWLGEQKIKSERVGLVGPKLRSFKRIFQKKRETGYRPRGMNDPEAATDTDP